MLRTSPQRPKPAILTARPVDGREQPTAKVVRPKSKAASGAATEFIRLGTEGVDTTMLTHVSEAGERLILKMCERKASYRNLLGLTTSEPLELTRQQVVDCVRDCGCS